MRYLIITFFVLFLVSCAADNSNNKTEVAKELMSNKTSLNKIEKVEKIDGKMKLLFFLDPDGGPCQMQDRILKSSKDVLDKKVVLKYISTANPDDRAKFYKYGIRYLPLLILADNEGKEIKRFSPGIIQKDQIINAIME